MDNNIVVFNSEEFGSVRTVDVNGDPWFVAADVCKALDISNTATRRLDEDEKFTLRLTQGETNRTSNMVVVNEPGLYSLVLGSKRKEAKSFKRWIVHDVIPSVRKNGGYIAGQEELSDEELLAKALTVQQRIIEERDRRIQEQQKCISDLTVQNQIMQPKADYFDQLVDRSLLTNFRTTAKELGVKEKVFIQTLIDKGFVYRDKRGTLIPKAGKEEYFSVKEFYNEKTGCKGVQTLITPQGRDAIRRIFE